MPEPKSTDGGGAEGEDEVSSVGLELMTKILCKQKNSRNQNNALKFWKMYQGSGAITQLWPPSKSSKMNIQGPLGFKSPRRTSPSALGRSGSQWSQPMWWKFRSVAHNVGPIEPLEPQHIGAQGTPIVPTNGREPKHLKNQKWA
ncbi:hypothetical protein O181_034880 [Austropuccinia psidii MF-1]|uniref:Uncharacterized protein n=1 Tax=Austropuccinia psidii MF-1 TaxID=1389203 RepID=A0A9Q3D3S9_9BASI|nr:hypothetical protein [Austropuccinia psidii MF-1]